MYQKNKINNAHPWVQHTHTTLDLKSRNWAAITAKETDPEGGCSGSNRRTPQTLPIMVLLFLVPPGHNQGKTESGHNQDSP